MNPLWLMRMARWARHPPSQGRVLLVLAIVLACAALYAAEQLGGLPDWMQAERVRGPMIR